VIWRQNPYEHGFSLLVENIHGVTVACETAAVLRIPVVIVNTERQEFVTRRADIYLKGSLP